MNRLTLETHPLITPQVLSDLHNFKIYNATDFVTAKSRFISCVTTLCYKDVCTLRKFFYTKVPLRNALGKYWEYLEQHKVFSSGLDLVDQLLKGGIRNNMVYEVLALPGNGKTLFCLHLSKSYIKLNNSIVYYLDTKHDFLAVKLKDLIELEEHDNEAIANQISRVHIMQCNTKYEALNALCHIQEVLKADVSKSNLIIVDCIADLFLPFTNKKRDNELMYRIVSMMKFLCAHKFVAFVVTNLLTKSINMTGCVEKIEFNKHWDDKSHLKMRIDKMNDNFLLKLVTADSYCSKEEGKSVLIAL